MSNNDENSGIYKLALFALTKADGERVAEIVNGKLQASPVVIKRIPKDQIRSVYNPMENDADHAFLTLFIKKQEVRKSLLDLFVKKQKDSQSKKPHIYLVRKTINIFSRRRNPGQSFQVPRRQGRKSK